MSFLQACGVKTVAMQSTGVYWIPLYEILEERGLEVYLVNARHTKEIERFTGKPQVVLEHYALNSARPKVISTV